MSFDWDKEVSINLTVRQLYFLMKCSESVLTMKEICDFMVGYEELTDLEIKEIDSALNAIVAFLKENR